MPFRRSVFLILFIVALLPLRAAADEPGIVRLSFGSGWDALPAVVATERGFFYQEGLVVSGLAISSAEAVLSSVVAGSTDFATIPQRTALVMAAAKLPFRIVGTNGWETQMELVAPANSSNITSVAGLKGKTVAIGVASEAFPVLVRLLNAAGLRPSDVRIVSLDAQALLEVFKTSSADAIFETRYYTATLVQTGQARVVLSNGDIVDTLGVTGTLPLIANSKVIETDAGIVQKFLNAWVKALAYIEQDPDDAARLLQIFFHRQGTTVQPELAKAWVSYRRYAHYTWLPNDIADADYNGWALVEGQILKVQPELKPYIDNRFAEKSAKQIQ